MIHQESHSLVLQRLSELDSDTVDDRLHRAFLGACKARDIMIRFKVK